MLRCLEYMTAKSKFFNFRPIFFVFLCFATGIIVVRYFMENYIVAIIVMILFIGVLIYYSAIYKSFKFMTIALIACFLGGIMFMNEVNKFNADLNVSSESEIVGVVESVTSNSYNMFIVKVLTIDGEDADVNIQLFCNDNTLDYTNIVDNKIKFVAQKVERNEIENMDKSSYLLKNNIKYYVTTSTIELLSSKQTLSTKIKTKIRDNMLTRLDNENVELMYSSLFGDKSELNNDLYSAYKITGVAHILAVSGLHVGLIATILKFLLNLFKCRKSISAIVVTGFLLFYCYLCDWSPSVVRATVMFSCIYWSAVFCRENDTLSSMGLAGLIIVAFKPSNLFNISFLLSFVCVLGINMFYSPVEKLLKKLHIHCKLTSALAMSTIVNLTIAPIMLYAFNTLNLAGVFLNIVVLPLFSFVFTCFFVLSILALIFAPLVVLFSPFNLILNCLNMLVSYVSKVGLSLQGNWISFLLVIMCLISCMFISKYNLKRGEQKLLAIMLSLCFIVFDLGLQIFLL